jgi:hypothetical protein
MAGEFDTAIVIRTMEMFTVPQMEHGPLNKADPSPDRVPRRLCPRFEVREVSPIVKKRPGETVRTKISAERVRHEMIAVSRECCVV